MSLSRGRALLERSVPESAENGNGLQNKSTTRELTLYSVFRHGQSLVHIMRDIRWRPFKQHGWAVCDLSRCGAAGVSCLPFPRFASRATPVSTSSGDKSLFSLAHRSLVLREHASGCARTVKFAADAAEETTHPHVPTLCLAAKTQERARAGDGNCTLKHDRLRSGRPLASAGTTELARMARFFEKADHGESLRFQRGTATVYCSF